MNTTLPQCEYCPLKGISLCGTFHAHNQTRYEALQRSYSLHKPKQIVLRQGTTPPSFLVVHQGWAIVYRILQSGQRQIFDVLLPGDAVDIRVPQGHESKVSIQTITAVRTCSFSREDFLDAVYEEPLLVRDVVRRLVEYAQILEDRLIEVSFHTAASRIAYLIKIIRKRLLDRNLLENPNTFDFPLTQAHIGDTIGLTAAHVNRTLRDLRAQGIVALEKGVITIHDLNELQELAKYFDS